MAQSAKQKYEADPLLKVDSAPSTEATTKGKGKNRTYPSRPLEKALAVARVIQDRASGTPLSRNRLAAYLDSTPNSSSLRDLLLASRLYGLTEGGVNADSFALTPLGSAATSDDEEQLPAWRRAVLNVAPYQQFLTAFRGKKLPAAEVGKDWLIANAGIPKERAEECWRFMLEDVRLVGFTTVIKGSDYIDMEGTPTRAPASGPLQVRENDDYDDDVDQSTTEISEQPKLTVVKPQSVTEEPQAPAKPKKVFVAHGKERGPMEQVKKMLDQFKVPCVVAVDEPHAGRPISTKVASLMRDECSSAIFIFTADERFIKKDDAGREVEVWRPSENAVYELGAASVLYDRRIVIFKDKRVQLPSDFSDLGHIPFEEGEIEKEMGHLFQELVSMDILEVRAKG